jgi:hypothetical protein
LQDALFGHLLPVFIAFSGAVANLDLDGLSELSP